MGSKIITHPRLREVVHCVEHGQSCDAQAIYRNSELLVVDGVAWDADISVIQSGLEPTRRSFKGPYFTLPQSPALLAELAKLFNHCDRLFRELYPDFVSRKRHSSFRPMITGPDPMHYDSIDGLPLVTAYINISRSPRIYNIGPSFPALLEIDFALMQKVLAEAKGFANFSYAIRSRTEKNRKPIDDATPRHRVELAPLSIWFFDAKTVSHEVVYGEGVAGVSWEVHGEVPTQQQYFNRIKEALK